MSLAGRCWGGFGRAGDGVDRMRAPRRILVAMLVIYGWFGIPAPRLFVHRTYGGDRCRRAADTTAR